MKQVILNIPESKFQFFMELVKNLGFVKTSVSEIPEEHKRIVRKRIADSTKNPERLLDYVSITENEIPQWQINEVETRLTDLEKHPEKAIDFDQTIERIEKKYGL